ncbi:hypothetical protein SRB17_87760 [Streptomyces sp. RB17]|uniref:hypothetical protein n=1 Tax=Streptomyces sp. RB17 TaxID=2585197 RepID=UPI001297C7F4|nr:hypothetical protein [Streptomyces sp. RB17]MQY40743.1 hypothetical protein [Streptomyces sp. RB17]
MIYGPHRAKGAPALGVLPGQDGPFGPRPAPGEDEAGVDADELAAMVPAPRDGSQR